MLEVEERVIPIRLQCFRIPRDQHHGHTEEDKWISLESIAKDFLSDLEKEDPSVLPEVMSSRPKALRVLSLDGGGSRGLNTLEMLKKIEDTAKELDGGKEWKIQDLFDYICGTGTGSIIALGLAAGWDVKTITDNYRDLIRDGVFRGQGKCNDETKLEESFKSLFGKNLQMNQLGRQNADRKDPIKVLIPVARCDYKPMRLVYFRNFDYSPMSNMDDYGTDIGNEVIPASAELVWQVARAATASPTYYKPMTIDSKIYMSAMLIANNPTMCALNEIANTKGAYSWAIVSVGTGEREGDTLGVTANDFNFSPWIPGIPGILTNLWKVGNVVDLIRRCTTDSDNLPLADVQNFCDGARIPYKRVNVKLRYYLPIDSTKKEELDEMIKEVSDTFSKELERCKKKDGNNCDCLVCFVVKKLFNVDTHKHTSIEEMTLKELLDLTTDVVEWSEENEKKESPKSGSSVKISLRFERRQKFRQDLAIWRREHNGDKQMVRVLSLDGGGVRGLVTLRIIQEIEKKTGKKITDLFDVFTGTSTGGIIALALAKGLPLVGDVDKPESPNYKPGNEEDVNGVIGMYRKFPKEIFRGQQQYDEQKLEKNLKATLKDLGMDQIGRDPNDSSDPLKPPKRMVIIPAVRCSDTYPMELKLFKNFDYYHRKGKYDNGKEVDQGFEATCKLPVWQVARATSAAPTYFKPMEINEKHEEDEEKKEKINKEENKIGKEEKAEKAFFLDGGMRANNPALSAICSLAGMKDFHISHVTSIGTGNVEEKINPKFAESFDFSNWSALGWLSGYPKLSWLAHPKKKYDLLSIALGCANDSSVQPVVQVRNLCKGLQIPYQRLNIGLEKEVGLDCNDRETIDDMEATAMEQASKFFEDNPNVVEELKELSDPHRELPLLRQLFLLTLDYVEEHDSNKPKNLL